MAFAFPCLSFLHFAVISFSPVSFSPPSFSPAFFFCAYRCFISLSFHALRSSPASVLSNLVIALKKDLEEKEPARRKRERHTKNGNAARKRKRHTKKTAPNENDSATGATRKRERQTGTRIQHLHDKRVCSPAAVS